MKKKNLEKRSKSKWVLEKTSISSGIFVVIFSIYLLRIFSVSRFETVSSNEAMTYWVHPGTQAFKSVEKVLNNIGFEKVNFKPDPNKVLNVNWHLTWTHPRHNEFLINYDKLKSFQKLNHFSGIQILADKKSLAMVIDLKYIPMAFTNHDDLKKYAEENPSKRFVERQANKAGISLKAVAEMNFIGKSNDDEFFAQEFVENPFLIEGNSLNK